MALVTASVLVSASGHQDLRSRNSCKQQIHLAGMGISILTQVRDIGPAMRRLKGARSGESPDLARVLERGKVLVNLEEGWMGAENVGVAI